MNSATSRDLPTPGIAADDDDAAALPSAQASATARKSRSSSSRPTSAPAGRARCLAFAADADGDERPVLALHVGRHALFGLEEVGDLAPGVGADDDLARAGEPAQARRGVDRVAGKR